MIMVAGFTSLVLAQDVPAEKKEDKKETSSFSGVIFMEYMQDLADDHAGVFAVNRVYLDWKKGFGDIFSVRVTTDALYEKPSGGNPDNEGYELLIKYAYLQAAPEIDPVKFKIQAGVIPTPTIALMNNLSGLRWIGNTYLGNSKVILQDYTIDSSADLGVTVSAEVMKMVTISGAVVKGEGYKKVQAESMVYGPSYYGLVSVKPLENIYINGFFRYNEIDSATTMMYYGGGLAWKDSMIKTGLNFVGVSYSNGTDTSGYFLEAWLNVNLDSLVGMPVLCIGKAGYGNFEDAKQGIFGFGPGWQFNKYVQTVLYYELTYDDSAAEDHNLYVKVEAKF